MMVFLHRRVKGEQIAAGNAFTMRITEKQHISQDTTYITTESVVTTVYNNTFVPEV
jgi:hypothetical protein